MDQQPSQPHTLLLHCGSQGGEHCPSEQNVPLGQWAFSHFMQENEQMNLSPNLHFVLPGVHLHWTHASSSQVWSAGQVDCTSHSPVSLHSHISAPLHASVSGAHWVGRQCPEPEQI